MWASDRITDANAVSGASEFLSGTKVPPHSPRAGVMPRAKRMTESNHFSKNNGYSECPKNCYPGCWSNGTPGGVDRAEQGSGGAAALINPADGFRAGSIEAHDGLICSCIVR